jgi:DNA replication protein DnaC
MTTQNNKVARVCEGIQKACTECEGSGCIKCARTISRVQKYAEAGIPASYWTVSFNNFKGDPSYADLVREVIGNIDSTYDSGKSYMFVGPLGVGKTFGISSILKMALCKEYTARYSSMVEVINQILSGGNSNAVAELLKYDFLAIDEFDNRWIFPSEKSEQIFGSTMEYILRSRFQNGLPTILATNNAEVDEILTGMHGKAFSSLRSQYMETVFLSGKDFRKRIK